MVQWIMIMKGMTIVAVVMVCYGDIQQKLLEKGRAWQKVLMVVVMKVVMMVVVVLVSFGKIYRILRRKDELGGSREASERCSLLLFSTISQQQRAHS